MTTALSGQLTSLTTLRAPWVTAAAALLGVAGIGGVIALTTHETIAPTGLLAGAGLGMLIVTVLATVAATGEQGAGTYRLAVMADPDRVRLLLAKCAVVGAVGAAVGAVGALVLGAVAAGSPHVADHWTGDDLRGLWGMPIVYGLAAVFAVAVGTLVRRTALGLSIVLALPLAVESLLVLIPHVGKSLTKAAPFTNSMAFLNPANAGADANSPGVALAVFAAWTLGLVALAAVTVRRRPA